jgi:energy-coupling factor transport system ATP-binding protein
MFEIEGVSFSYPNGYPALSDITVTLNRGDFILVTGWNGSGKTTFAKLLNGLLVPSSGSILFDGHTIAGTPTSQLAKRVGFVFQNPDHQLHKPTVKEEIGYSLKNFGYEKGQIQRRVDAIAEQFDLVPLLERSPQELTASEKKLVTTASVLVYEPQVVVVDEATAHLDKLHVRKVMRMLETYHRKERVILNISHNIPVWAECILLNRVLVMESGRIRGDGSPKNIFTNDTVMKYLTDGVMPITRIARELRQWDVDGTLYSIHTLERKLLSIVKDCHV